MSKIPAPHHAIALRQRRTLRDAADRIEAGESLQGLDPGIIAAALRGFADRIPNEPKKGRGHQPKVNRAWVKLKYQALIQGKCTGKNQAINAIADEAGISPQAVKKILKPKAAAKTK